MVEAAESVWMMDAAYRGGPPLSTHILCLQGSARPVATAAGLFLVRRDASDIAPRHDRDDPRVST
jgi:hypothetical protein